MAYIMAVGGCQWWRSLQRRKDSLWWLCRSDNLGPVCGWGRRHTRAQVTTSIATRYYNITWKNHYIKLSTSDFHSINIRSIEKIVLIRQKNARNQITSKLLIVSSSPSSFEKCFYVGIFSHRQANVVNVIQRYAFLQEPVKGRQMPTLRSPAGPNWRT